MSYEYSAGDLSFSIASNNANALKSIDQMVLSLNKMSKALTKINNSDIFGATQRLQYLFNEIAVSTNKIDSTNLERLASATKSLSAISKLSNLNKIDFAKVSDGFSQLAVAIEPFIEKVKGAEVSLNALVKLQKKMGKEKTTSSKKGGSFNFLSFAKWTAIIYAGKRLGNVVSNIAQYGADYTETLNLWETSMGNNLSIATEFVNKMNQAYGISEKTLMNAQAIFKNMLGSLGQISDTMAYSLSEGVTQMALDYASLYNVTFEKAFTKFQAALAGQVRPIRSVSGYDITENTLYQLYQSLGGTKTMRQLSRTEKQLLSILAIFNQMTASGAVGDLEKTMESYANQSRVMAEAWQQVLTYAGSLLTYMLQESGILVKINAVLMFIGDVLKAVAEEMGAIQHFGGDAFGDLENSAESASKEIDALQGKLFDFDKFRSLGGGAETDIGIDQTVLSAVSQYSTILENASMSARELADAWKVASGFFDEEGVFNIEKFNGLLTTLKTTLVGVGLILVEVFGAVMVGKIIKFVNHIQELRLQNALATTSFQKLQLATTSLISGIMALSMGITTLILSWGDMSELGKVLTIVISLAAAIGAAAAALYLFKQNYAMAIGVGATVLGTGLTIGSQLSTLTAYKNGGLPEKGSMFLAGESGAEIVYNSPNGQSGVVNVNQISQAMYNALVRYGRSQDNKGQPLVVYLDGEVVYQNTTAKAKAHGNVWGKA